MENQNNKGDMGLDIELDLDFLKNPMAQEETILDLDVDLDLGNAPNLDIYGDMETNFASVETSDDGSHDWDSLDFDLPEIPSVQDNLDEALIERISQMRADEVGNAFDPFDELFNEFESFFDDNGIPIEKTDVDEEESEPAHKFLMTLLNSLLKFIDKEVLLSQTSSNALNKSKLKNLSARISRHGLNIHTSTALATALMQSSVNLRGTITDRILKQETKYIIDSVVGNRPMTNSELSNLYYLVPTLLQNAIDINREADKANKKLPNIIKKLAHEFYEHINRITGVLNSIFSKDDSKIVYYKSLSYNVGEGYEYTCGGCGTVIKYDKGPFTALIYPQSTMFELIVEPVICANPECDCANIMRKSRYNELKLLTKESLINSHHKWMGTNSGRLSTYVNYFIYQFPYTMFTLVEGDENTSIDDINDEDDELKMDFESMRLAMIRKYKESIVNLTQLESTYANVAEKFSDKASIINAMAKYLCVVNKVSYHDTTRKALGSLYNHLNSIPSLQLLISENQPISDAIYESRLLLDLDVDIEIKLRVLSRFGIKSLDGIEKAREILKTYGQTLEKYKETRQKFSSLMPALIRFFMFTPIRDYSYTNEFSLMGANKDFLDNVDFLVDLMIVTHFSSTIYKAWHLIEVNKVKNQSLFKAKDRFDPVPLSKAYAKIGLTSSPDSISQVYNRSHTRNRFSTLFKNVNALRGAIKTGDKFTFLFRVSDIAEETAPVFKDLYLSLKTYETEAFMLSASMRETKLDFYKYHYPDMFTDQEIEDGLFELQNELVVPLYEVKREEDESFESYITRVKEVNSSGKGVPNLSSNILSANWDTNVLLAAISSVEQYRNVHGPDRFNKNAFLGELILNLDIFPKELIFKIFGLPKPSDILIKNEVKYTPDDHDQKEIDRDAIILEAIFSIEDMNSQRETSLEEIEQLSIMKSSYETQDLIQGLSYSEVLRRYFA